MLRTCKMGVLDIADKKIMKLKDKLAKIQKSREEIQPEIQRGKKKKNRKYWKEHNRHMVQGCLGGSVS